MSSMDFADLCDGYRILSSRCVRLSYVSSGESVERLHADLDDLLAVDVVGLPDQTVRDELLDLLAAENRLHAAITARVASFDSRDLADGDACRTTAVWLGVFGRRSERACSGLLKRARLLRRMPALADATARVGATSNGTSRSRRFHRPRAQEAAMIVGRV